MKFSRCVKPAPPTGKRVAIIGSGPAGLGAAGILICKGHEVHIYDKNPIPGGLLIYGIPDFRIPKKNVFEGIEDLKRLGVKFILNKKVVDGDGEDEKTIGFIKLVREYDAVLIATGTWKERRLNIEGEDLPRVYPALDYMIKYCQAEINVIPFSELPPLGDSTVVIGAGLTAVDAATVAVKLGVKNVYMVYRRTINEAPARRHEIEKVIKLGVKWIELANPKRFIGDHNKGLEAVELLRMRLGEKDASGRPRPIPIEGSEFILEVDSALVAIGEIPTPPTIKNPELKLNRDGSIWVDEKMRTSIKGVFAAGDVVIGPSLIGKALASGIKAANSIDEYLKTL